MFVDVYYINEYMIFADICKIFNFISEYPLIFIKMFDRYPNPIYLHS